MIESRSILRRRPHTHTHTIKQLHTAGKERIVSAQFKDRKKNETQGVVWMEVILVSTSCHVHTTLESVIAFTSFTWIQWRQHLDVVRWPVLLWTMRCNRLNIECQCCSSRQVTDQRYLWSTKVRRKGIQIDLPFYYYKQYRISRDAQKVKCHDLCSQSRTVEWVLNCMKEIQSASHECILWERKVFACRCVC